MAKEPTTIWKNSHVHWTREKAQADPSVTQKDGKYYIDAKEIVFDEQQGMEIIEREYKSVPPSTGYQRFYSALCGTARVGGKYVGLRRTWVRSFLDNAESRQIYRRLHKPSSTKAIVATAPGKRLQCDIKYLPITFLGSKRLTGILVILDLFSKWVFAYPVSSENVDDVIKGWDAYFDQLGPELSKRVRLCQSDNGPALSSHEFSNYLQDKGIKLIHAKAYSPQSSGAVERMNSTLGGLLTSSAEQRYGRATAWNLVLPETIAFINGTWSRVIRTTPDLAFHTDGEPDPKIREHLETAAKSRRNTMLYSQLTPGQTVRVSVRVDSDAKTKGALKNGTRKGYLRNWSLQTYTVSKRRGNTYSLVNEPDWGFVDRLNLLLIPSDEPYRQSSPAPAERGERGQRSTNSAPPSTEPRPVRAKRTTMNNEYDYNDTEHEEGRPQTKRRAL